MTNKFLLNHRVLWLLIPLLTLFNFTAWGTDVTTTFVKKSDSKTWAQVASDLPCSDGGLSWASSANPTTFDDSGGATWDARGLGYGSGADPTLTASQSGTITQVSIVASTNAGASKASLSVTVGSTTFKNNSNNSVYIASGTASANSTYDFTGSATGTIAVSVNNTVSDKTVWIKSITVTYSSAADPYTVTFNPQGGYFDDDSPFTRTSPSYQIDEAYAGAGVTLPAASTDCGSDGWAFYGWATSACSSSTGTAPTIVGKAGDTYYPADDITLHAVFAKGEFTKITSTDDLSSGAKYLIVVKYSSKNYILKSSSDDYSTTSHKMASAQVDETSTGKYHITAIDPNWRYSIEGSTGNWRIRDVVNATNNYLDVAYTDWWGKAYDSDDPYKITVSAGGVWSLNCHYYYKSNYYDAYVSFDETNKLFQANSSTYSILLYKQTTTPAYWSSPTCCEKPSALTKGSFSRTIFHRIYAFL